LVVVDADVCCVLAFHGKRVDAVNVAVSSDTVSTGSPRSPRTGLGQPEKTMSAIAATHQTMTSLLSKPSE